MAFISAQTGTMIFAIINLIIVFGVSLFGIASFTFMFLSEFYYNNTPAVDNKEIMLICQASAAVLFLFLSLVTLMFSSFLVHGILKKKPGHIKAYYIYGVLTVTLSLIALIIVSSVDIDIADFMYAIILGILVIYSLILHMIRYTYLQLEMNRDQFDHQRLVEDKI